jgi:hypothetical protein
MELRKHFSLEYAHGDEIDGSQYIGAHDQSAPLDGVEVGDCDDGADDGSEHDPAGDVAEEEVLERRRQPRLRGLRDLGEHQRRRHGPRGGPLLHGLLRRSADGDGRRPARRGAQRRRADGRERLTEATGYGQRRRDGGGSHMDGTRRVCPLICGACKGGVGCVRVMARAAGRDLDMWIGLRR